MELKLDQVKSVLREFVAGNFMLGKDSRGLGDRDSFLDSGLVDSTGILEFVAFLEEKWGVAVADEELLPENFDSLENLSAFVVRKAHGASA
jgi:acyl carrier protein